MGDELMHDEIELVTPGHGAPLDTLIVLGLVSAVLNVNPESKVTVEREGDRYRINLDGHINNQELIEYIAEELKFEAERASVARHTKLAYILSPQPGIRSKLVELANVLSKRKFDVFKEYTSPDHTILRDEGRGKEGKGKRKRGKSEKVTAYLQTAYLQIAPWAGKYTLETYAASEDTYYNLCPLCASLAWLGLLSAVATIYIVGKDSRKVLYVAPDPVTSETPDLALLTLVLGEKCEQILALGEGREPPLLAAPLLTLASGETLYPLRGRYEVVVWEHSKVGQFIGIKGLAHLPLRPLLEFVAEAKSRSMHLLRLVEYIKSKDPQLLAEVVECLTFGEPDPYSVVRDIWSLLVKKDEEGGGDIRWLDRGIVGALYNVWQGRFGGPK